MSNPLPPPSSASPQTQPARQAPGWALPAFQWLTIVNAVLMVVQAFLASEGVFGGERNLVTGHGHLGNLVFLLVVAQAVLAFVLANAGRLPRMAVTIAAVIVLLTVAQIGLGYSTRNDVGLAAWHIPNGVLLMGGMAVLATMAWTRRPEASSAR
ncbi:MAG: hypothetical protein ACTHQE_01040 [Thermomicrobiales bacterium]